MVDELDLDVSENRLYISPRLTGAGTEAYEPLIREAVRERDDVWLANQLRRPGNLRSHEERKKRGGGTITAKVPVTAPETLGEGEFNRFYARGLCLRATEDGIPEVEVYRGKEVRDPRQESQAMIGKTLPADALLQDLRNSVGVDTALRLPPGPNSGLTVRLP